MSGSDNTVLARSAGSHKTRMAFKRFCRANYDLAGWVGSVSFGVAYIAPFFEAWALMLSGAVASTVSFCIALVGLDE